TNI
ncbi:hypothetical protein CFC21_095765, partial [Triticum aestivum]